MGKDKWNLGIKISYLERKYLMENIENKIFEYQLITDKVIFADGLTRSGKALLSNILLGFQNVSSIQFLDILEQILPMLNNDKISKNATSALIRLHLNQNFYNYKISRNLNFRYDDLTGIHNSSNPKQFYKNLNKKDDDTVIDELLQKDIYFQFQTHEILAKYSSFLELNIEAIIIEIFRHPIDTAHSWYKRGWGTRYDKADPRNWATLFHYESHIIPHCVIGYEEEYIKLNEMEKCIFMHNIVIRKSIEQYKKLNFEKKKKIHIIKYEDLLSDTNNELDKISQFLNLKMNSYMKEIVDNKIFFPSKNKTNRIEKLNEIKKNVDIKLYNDLMSLSEYYDNYFYDLED